MHRCKTLAVVLSILLSASLAGATTSVYWQGGATATNDWETAANWDPNGVPSIAGENQCWIINGGTARITQPGQSAQYLRLGYGLGEAGHVRLESGTFETSGYEQIGREGDGTFTQKDATTNIVGDTLTIAEGRPGALNGTGTYVLDGGLLRVNAGHVNLGYYAGASGHLMQSGGTFGPLAADRYLYLGRGEGTLPGGFGRYAITGGTMAFTNSNWVSVGEYGTGEFHQSGGTVAVDRQVTIGRRGGGRGTYSLHGGEASFGIMVVGEARGATGTVEIVGGHLHLGDQSTIGQIGHGEVRQTGGTVTMANVYYLSLGHGGGEGRYLLSGNGALMLTNDNNYLSVGRDAMGTFEQSNGTVNVKNYVIVGHNSGSVGRYTIRDGSLTAGGNLDVGQVAAATGTFTVLGSGADITIGGDYNQTANSTLDVRPDANGLSAIKVAKTATLNGELKITAPDLDYNTMVTVIDAGALSGAFSSTTLVLPLTQVDVVYDTANGDVKLTHFKYQFPTVVSIR